MTDLISRADAIDAVCESCSLEGDYHKCDGYPKDSTWCEEITALRNVPSAQQWIPVKWHEITDEEREDEGYPKDWVAVFDSEMPYDGQKILVTTKWFGVAQDECYADGEYALDSGWDWIDDILAWMPLPEPYRKTEPQTKCKTCKWGDVTDEHCEICGIAGIDNYEPQEREGER